MRATVRQRLCYIAGDFVACEIGTLLFNIWRHYRLHADASISFAEWSADTSVVLSYAAFPCVMIALFGLFGFYNNPLYKSRYEAVTNALTGSLIGSLVIYFAIAVNDDFNERSLHYSILCLLWFSFLVPVVLSRFLVRRCLLRCAAEGEGTYNVVIVGSTEEAVEYASRLEKANYRMGYRVVGVLDPDIDFPRQYNYPALTFAGLDSDINARGVKAFVVLASKDRHDWSLRIINRLCAYGRTIFLPLDFYNVITTRPKLSNIIGEPLVDITTPALTSAQANIKRICDILVSVLAMILLLPAGLVIAVLVKLDSNGPIIFRQERVGLHSKKFIIYKFRSMVKNAEANGPQLSSSADSRVTRLGHILRKYRLDELPQFWNVLRGDMSLVGPRPEREYFLRKLAEREPAIFTLHNVRPGLTSLGVIKCGYASHINQMVDRLYFDLLYVENISFSLDLRILFHTVNTVLTGKGI